MAVNIKKDFGNTRNRKPDINNLVYGKVPPQEIQAEEAVLGAMMLEKDKLDEVLTILPEPECFYDDKHQHIYKSIISLYKSGSPVDLVTVVADLNKTGMLEAVGGAYYVTKLCEGVVSSAHVEAHARIVLEKYMARQIISISGKIIGAAYDAEDVFDLLNYAEHNILSISSSTIRSSYRSAKEIVMKTIRQIEQNANSGQRFIGVPTGYDALDRLTYGWQPGDLVILAARPSVGKTAFALNLAWNAITHPHKPVGVGVFSLEMSDTKLMQRMISLVSMVPMDQIKRGRLSESDWKKINEAGVSISSSPLLMDETGGINIHELRSKARKMVTVDGVGMIIIDYLQLMQGDDNGKYSNREAEVSKISRSLKSLAKELEIPIIALSQLNRGVENRKDGKGEPNLSDLRESGAIEQDADSVIFLYRPDYQKPSADSFSVSDVHVKIAKHRDGKVDKLLLRSVLSIQRFFDPEQYTKFSGKIDFSTNSESKVDKPFEGMPGFTGGQDKDDLPF